jgi:hypothetical protein
LISVVMPLPTEHIECKLNPFLSRTGEDIPTSNYQLHPIIHTRLALFTFNSTEVLTYQKKNTCNVWSLSFLLMSSNPLYHFFLS